MPVSKPACWQSGFRLYLRTVLLSHRNLQSTLLLAWYLKFVWCDGMLPAYGCMHLRIVPRHACGQWKAISYQMSFATAISGLMMTAMGPCTFSLNRSQCGILLKRVLHPACCKCWSNLTTSNHTHLVHPIYHMLAARIDFSFPSLFCCWLACLCMETC